MTAENGAIAQKFPNYYGGALEVLTDIGDWLDEAQPKCIFQSTPILYRELLWLPLILVSQLMVFWSLVGMG